MKNDVILLDGAVGTSLWEKTDNKVPVWRYNLENPSIVSVLHHEYIEAGAKIILANTFGANRAMVKKTEYSVHDIVSTGVRLAKEAVVGTDVKVALSIGPLSELMEPYGDMTIEEADDIYSEMIGAGMEEHPDYITIQTFMDIEMMKVAVNVANRYDVPLMCAMSFEKSGHTMMGNTVSDMIEGLKPYRVDVVGLNCSLGPDAALPIMKEFRKATDLPLMFKPNAGKPSGDGKMEFDIETFVCDVAPAVDIGVKYIGGCCGTNPDYIRALKEKLEQL